MSWRVQQADLVAATVLGVLACSVGTALGLVAADVRAKTGPRSGPLRMIPSGSTEIPSNQRDRIRFRGPGE
jgi:hypothetical protein